MRRRKKEQAIIRRRKKLWSHMGWAWPFKRNDGGNHKTEWTSDEHESDGEGYFRKNHSLSCKDHAVCRSMMEWKVRERRKERRKRKLEEKELLKIATNNLEL